MLYCLVCDLESKITLICCYEPNPANTESQIKQRLVQNKQTKKNNESSVGQISKDQKKNAGIPENTNGGFSLNCSVQSIMWPFHVTEPASGTCKARRLFPEVIVGLFAFLCLNCEVVAQMSVPSGPVPGEDVEHLFEKITLQHS